MSLTPVSDPSTCRDHIDAIVTAGRFQPRPAVTPQFSRTNPAHVAAWRQTYTELFSSFASGALDITHAAETLRSLNFKDDALKVEILELIKARSVSAGHAASRSIVP